MMRNVVDVLLGALFFGKVVGDAQESGDAFVCISESADDELHGDTRAILSNVCPLPFVDETLFGGEAKDMMIRINLETELRRQLSGAVCNLEGVVKVGVGASKQVGLLIPEHSFSGRVDAGDHACFVGDDDAERGAGDDRFIEAECAGQVLLILNAEGDIGERHDDAILKLDYLDVVATGDAAAFEERMGELKDDRITGAHDVFVDGETVWIA